jgi:hypothetical protein
MPITYFEPVSEVGKTDPGRASTGRTTVLTGLYG